MSSGEKRYWRIRGHKKFETFLDITIPVRCLTEGRLRELLKCLLAKANMEYEEIVGAYVKRGTRVAHDFLEVHKNGPYPEYHCGIDAIFVAIVVDEHGDRVKYPVV